MNRNAYKNQVLELLKNEALLSAVAFPELLRILAVEFFVNPSLKEEFKELETETRRRIKQLKELGLTDE